MVNTTNGTSIKCPVCSDVRLTPPDLYKLAAEEMAKASEVIVPDESIKVIPDGDKMTPTEIEPTSANIAPVNDKTSRTEKPLGPKIIQRRPRATKK